MYVKPGGMKGGGGSDCRRPEVIHSLGLGLGTRESIRKEERGIKSRWSKDPPGENQDYSLRFLLRNFDTKNLAMTLAKLAATYSRNKLASASIDE